MMFNLYVMKKSFGKAAMCDSLPEDFFVLLITLISNYSFYKTADDKDTVVNSHLSIISF